MRNAAEQLSLRQQITQAMLGGLAAFLISFAIVFTLHACGPWW